jgi:uncharacterized lipoprotein
MKTTTLIVATALALGALAGCDRKPEPRTTVTTPPSQAGSGTSTAPSGTTQNTPANAGTPNAAEKREGSNPVQGQVDPKQPEQNKDFKQSGDAAGPKQ